MIAALLTAVVFAQLPGGVHSARVVVEPPVAPFHKHVTMTVEVISNPDVDVKILPVDPEGLNGLSIYGDPEFVDELSGDEQRRVAAVYTLDAIRPNDYPIAPIRVEVGDASFEIAAPTIRFRDLTPEEEAAILQMAANAGPGEVPARPVLPWVLGGAALLAAAGAVAYWLLRAKPKRAAGPPPKTPWELAYDRIRALDARGLPAAGKFGRYYVELSQVLREYLEDRYHLHAPERTTPEFLAEASKSGQLSDEQQALVGSLLKLSDRVKFAQYASSVEEAEGAMADVLQFVDESIPQESPSADEEAA